MPNNPYEPAPRDPFLEMLWPAIQASGSPIEAAVGNPFVEGAPTGDAMSIWDRVLALAQFAGNALPFRGGLAVGDKGLRAILSSKALQMTDQAGPASVAAKGQQMRPTQFPTLDPGGWQNTSLPDSWIKRWLRFGPDTSISSEPIKSKLWERQRGRELEMLREMLNSPQGANTPPFGPGFTTKPWGN